LLKHEPLGGHAKFEKVRLRPSQRLKICQSESEPVNIAVGPTCTHIPVGSQVAITTYQPAQVALAVVKGVLGRFGKSAGTDQLVVKR
jgi:hypothetical protein